MPLWVQLRQRIMHLISTGYFKPGDKLPTVRGLAQEVSINYNTVNKRVSEPGVRWHFGVGSRPRRVRARCRCRRRRRTRAGGRGHFGRLHFACRDLGLSLEDIQQHMTRRILQLQKAQAGGESCGEGARIVRVDVHQGAANAQTGA